MDFHYPNNLSDDNFRKHNNFPSNLKNKNNNEKVFNLFIFFHTHNQIKLIFYLMIDFMKS